MAILADHLLVPSSTLCVTAFMWPEWLFSSQQNIALILSIFVCETNVNGHKQVNIWIKIKKCVFVAITKKNAAERGNNKVINIKTRKTAAAEVHFQVNATKKQITKHKNENENCIKARIFLFSGDENYLNHESLWFHNQNWSELKEFDQKNLNSKNHKDKFWIFWSRISFWFKQTIKSFIFQPRILNYFHPQEKLHKNFHSRKENEQNIKNNWKVARNEVKCLFLCILLLLLVHLCDAFWIRKREQQQIDCNFQVSF